MVVECENELSNLVVHYLPYVIVTILVDVNSISLVTRQIY